MIFLQITRESAGAGGTLQILLLLVFVVPLILFLLTQQNTLKAIRPENRSMNPGHVWLQLIPLFGQVWQFIVVSRISESLGKELASGSEDSILGVSDSVAEGGWSLRPTYGIGMAYCTLITISFFPVPLAQGLFSLAGMICWVIYWVRVARLKNKLSAAGRN